MVNSEPGFLVLDLAMKLTMLTLDSSQVIVFGQWGISKYNASGSLISAIILGCEFSESTNIQSLVAPFFLSLTFPLGHQVVWYFHLFKNFPQFVVIHTVKVFGIVNKAEIDVFLECS